MKRRKTYRPLGATRKKRKLQYRDFVRIAQNIRGGVRPMDVVMAHRPVRKRSPEEIKYFDCALAATVLGDTWAGGEIDPALGCLFAPTQGSGEEQRKCCHLMP